MRMKKRTILHLCADTGSDTWPYRNDPRYEVITVGSDIGVENYSPDRPIHGVVANPPCTEFSRAREDNRVKHAPQASADHGAGMVLVDHCIRIIEECDESLAWWVIENPATGALRNYMGAPDYSYEPWWYGSSWSKRTGLWGDFNVPPRVYSAWDQVPDKLPLYTRPPRPGRLNWVQKPSFRSMHRKDFQRIPEFYESGMPAPTEDSEFRSLCSQKFALAFKNANP